MNVFFSGCSTQQFLMYFWYAFGRFAWKWVRARETDATGTTREVVRERIRIVRVKEPGDVNVSTLMSLAMLAGLALLAAIR